MEECKGCGAAINSTDTRCEYCGRERIIENIKEAEPKNSLPKIKVSNDTKKSLGKIGKLFLGIVKFHLILYVIGISLVVISIVVLVIGGYVKKSKQESHSVSNSSIVAQENNYSINIESDYENTTGVYKSGEYAIGRDIDAGEYIFVATGPSLTGHITVYSDAQMTNEIYSATHTKGDIFVFDEGQYISVSWGVIYDTSKVADIFLDPFSGDGTYRIGKDIDAGEYILSPSDEEYKAMSICSIYSRLTSAGPIIKENKNITEPTKITLKDGEYLAYTYCILSEA